MTTLIIPGIVLGIGLLNVPKVNYGSLVKQWNKERIVKAITLSMAQTQGGVYV